MDNADSPLHRRTSIITANVLREYQEMISDTTSDLEEHLEQIDSKLQIICIQGAGLSAEDAAERQKIQEERTSTQQCLDICNQVRAKIDQVQPNAFINLSLTELVPITTLSDLTSAQQVTATTFKACKEKLNGTTVYLENQLQDINNRLSRFSIKPTNMSIEQATEREIMQEERAAVLQSLKICAEASKEAVQEKSNLYEDILVVDDSQQVIISTVGALISAKRVTGGSRSFQVFGQISDDSFQLLSRQIGAASTVEEPERVSPQFENRYGTGITLKK
jgi:hypothetical protein